MPDFENEHKDPNDPSTIQRNSQQQYFYKMKEEFFPGIKQGLDDILDAYNRLIEYSDKKDDESGDKKDGESGDKKEAVA